MHSAGLELTKLTYTRLEDNLIRHRGDRYMLQSLLLLLSSLLLLLLPLLHQVFVIVAAASATAAVAAAAAATTVPRLRGLKPETAKHELLFEPTESHAATTTYIRRTGTSNSQGLQQYDAASTRSIRTLVCTGIQQDWVLLHCRCCCCFYYRISHRS